MTAVVTTFFVRKDINYLQDKHIRVFDGWGG